MSTFYYIFRRSAAILCRRQHPVWIFPQSCRLSSDRGVEHDAMFSAMDEEVEIPENFTEKTVSRDRATQKHLCTLPPDSPPDARMLNVAIIGGPNAGKSTLVNDFLCRKVNAVSSKINTTRKNTISAFTEDNAQIVFVDTPGLFVPARRKKLHLDEQIGRDPERCLHDADIVGVVVDVADSYTRTSLHEEVLKLLHLYRHLPSFLILNKIDMLTSKELLLPLTRKLCQEVVRGVEIGRKIGRKSVNQNVKTKTTKYDTLFSELEAKYGTVQESDSNTEDSLSSENETDMSQGTFIDLEKYGNLSMEKDTMEDKQKKHLIFKQKHTEQSRLLNIEKNKVENILARVNVGSGDGISTVEGTECGTREIPFVEQLERQKAAKLAILKHQGWPHFQRVFMVSALLGQQTADIKEYLIEKARPGAWKYHSCMVTQQDTFEIAKCKVFETLLEHLPGIIPYEVTLSISYWDIVQNDDLLVVMEICVPKKHYLASLIGPKGKTMATVSHDAEQALMDVFHCNVILKLEAYTPIKKRHGTRHSQSRPNPYRKNMGAIT